MSGSDIESSAARDGWSIVETRFRPETARAYESLCTLGSGYLHVRGSLEEHLSDSPQNVDYTRVPTNVTSEQFRESKCKWGTYLPGVFGRHPLLNREMVNLPFFLGIVPIVDGERLDLEACTIEEYRRELRLDCATLRRSLVWRTRSDKRVTLAFERFVSAARPHLCVQRLTIKTDAPAKLELWAGVDADVRTNGYDHFRTVNIEASEAGRIDCLVTTDDDDAIALQTQVLTESNRLACERGVREALVKDKVELAADREYVLEKRTAAASSRDPEGCQPGRWLSEAEGKSFDELHAEHTAVWHARWERCDVVIEGDARSQLAMRTATYHLLRAHVGGDPRVAIGPKGYSGDAYWGRFFWDTELFLLPFYLYTDSERARTLTDFRVNTLPGARANAARYGCAGARYAWESDADGVENCPNWQYADHELHVTADVAYGLVHVARATDDVAYLNGAGAEVLVDTARYWMSRLDWSADRRRPKLLGVMGPDEYTPISNNNSFTNRMVAFALSAAAEVGAAGWATAEECAAFREAAGALPMPRAENGSLVLQCDGFDQLAEPRFDELWRDRTRSFAEQVSQDRLIRSKCLKQPDVLMLMMLFPDEFSDDEVRRAWDYYEPLTTHDSSLSAGVHAIVAARLGLMDEALRFWRIGSEIDLDVERGLACEGVHIAAAGAVWQMAVLGFGGLRTAMQSDVLTLTPRLPTVWTRLAFPIVWKNTPVAVEITANGPAVTNHGDRALEVCVDGVARQLSPGERATWQRPREQAARDRV